MHNAIVADLAERFSEQPHLRVVLFKTSDSHVEILRDRWGVPHIYAKTTADVIFAQGFVHAQERLWQMDFNRRLVAGRLSEILGPVSVSLDRWMRALTMRRVGESEIEILDDESHKYWKLTPPG